MLTAAGPHPDHAEELMLYGRFVGAWDIEAQLLGDDGTWRRHRGEWHFLWVLEGRAIQDVLICPPLAERSIGQASFEYGTTLRQYDPGSGTWRIVYVSPVTGSFRRLTGGPNGDGIMQEGEDPDGTLIRWAFTEITADSFLWQGFASTDGGQTWVKNEQMRATRR